MNKINRNLNIVICDEINGYSYLSKESPNNTPLLFFNVVSGLVVQLWTVVTNGIVSASIQVIALNISKI